VKDQPKNYRNLCFPSAFSKTKRDIRTRNNFWGNAIACSCCLCNENAQLHRIHRGLTEAEIRLLVANERIEERDALDQKSQTPFEQISSKALKDNNQAFDCSRKAHFLH
jgi:hypothetical protein